MDLAASYEAGKFDEALQAVQSQADGSATYFFNTGTIYYRMGKLGASVAYLERANRLQPHDPATQKNLGIARGALGRVLGERQLDPASGSWEAMADRLSLDEVRGTIGLLGLILALLWLRAYLKTRNLKSTLFQPAGIFGILGFAITLGLYGAQRLAAVHPPAVLIDRQVVRSGPGDHFFELSEVEAGVKVRILGPTAESKPAASGKAPEEWRQVRYSQSSIGWIRSTSLLLL